MRVSLEAEQQAVANAWLATTLAQQAQRQGERTPIQRPDSITMESRAWSDTIDWLAMMMQFGAGSDADTLAAIAAEITSQAADMDGPMPPEVVAFVEQHGRPAV